MDSYLAAIVAKKDFCCSIVSMLCYKTNGKRRSVYYWVMDALRRFAKHPFVILLKVIAFSVALYSWVIQKQLGPSPLRATDQ